MLHSSPNLSEASCIAANLPSCRLTVGERQSLRGSGWQPVSEVGNASCDRPPAPMGRKRRRQSSGSSAPAGTAQQAGVRPEHCGPAAELYGADHERYHGQNAGLQRDMAELAVALLGLHQQTADGDAEAPPASAFLADLGCGSGLSAAALGRQAGVGGWVGTDITPQMAQLAARQPGSSGRLAVQDFGQGLPFRPACLDGAISVSAVQWLCAAADPAASIRRFFSGLAGSLRPGARAALQVYAEDDGQAQQLLAGALAAGLDAGFFVSLPHATAAKKFYLLCERPAATTGQQQARQSQQARQAPQAQQQQAQQGQQAQQRQAQPGSCRCMSARPCNLAWPKTGSCLLAWRRRLEQGQPGQEMDQAQQQGQQQGSQPESAQQQHDPQTAGAAAQLSPAAEEAARRLQREHAATGRRMVRLLRRAEALSAAQQEPQEEGTSSGGNGGPAAAAAAGDGTGNPGGSANGSGTGSLVVQAELEAWGRLGLMPCGGPVFVQLTAAAELLEAGSPGHGSAAAEEVVAVQQQAAAEAADAGAEADVACFAPALEAAARALLGPASTAGAAAGQVHCTLAKPAGQEEAEQHVSSTVQQGVRLFAAPPVEKAGAGGNGTAGGNGSKGGKGASAAHRFMRLEPLESVQGQQQGPAAADEQQQQAGAAARQQRAGAAGQPALAAAVLHAHKSAQHLVLRCSLAGGPAGCGHCAASSSRPGGSTGADGPQPSAAAGLRSSQRSSQCHLACAICMADRLEGLCRELNGCLIGLDARLFAGGAEATWLVWLAGLQQLDRAQLSAAVLRHFPVVA